ncbi:cation diffusion facilitator family transporter [Albidovulum sediminicola]|uniref:Cation diffusion facilitator family transporter n=1 Tax=Albidovulum sediminicola TaxID=2984331 RepID=A0ABT2Z3C4_9RHOB|nr:cation diffusion facilitator family transporter [Defluviimonas sp. WL0075]MCV2865644.1 cation diffusion facilitator family transporter [Defluviimonas sp. WL0075]
MSSGDHNRLNISAGLASVAVAATLVGLKLWALGLTSSLSVAASLADNALDLMMSLGGLLAIIYAARPADEDHAFGHTSVEDLAALAQSIFIAVSGMVIAWAAAARLLGLAESRIAAQDKGIAVMGVSVLLTLCLVLWQRQVARRTGSRVVAADSLHYLSDLLPTLGAIGALWASRRFGLAHVDSVVALASAAILLSGAIRIGKGAWDALMDRTADPELVEAIAAIARAWPGVRGFHDLKTRMAGSRVFVHIHIELDGDQSLREAHAIGAGLRRRIIETYPQCDVIVHKDVARET